MTFTRGITIVRRALSLGFLIVLFAGVPAGAQTAPAAVQLSDVSVTTQPDAVTVHVKTSRAPKYQAELIDSPYRLIVDLENATYAWRKTPLTVGAEPLRQIRGSQYKKGVARLVVDLTRKVGYAIREDDNGLAIIIPTLNERDNVPIVVERLNRALAGIAWEAIFVDDDSPDGTADVVRALSRRQTNIRCLQRLGRRGLASACIDGILASAAPYAAVMDGDLSHPPELLPALVGAVRSGREIAIASRSVSGATVLNWPWKRRVLSRLGNLLARPLVPVADATSGYFVCQVQLVKSLMPDARGFKILLEILVRGGVQRVQEVPYAFTDRVHGSSKLAARTMWCYLIQLIQLYHFRVSHPRASTSVSTQKAVLP